MADLSTLLLTPADASALVADRVRAARRRVGWTQAELARRAGVGVATIGRLEASGQGQLSTLYQVCAALGRLRDFEEVLAVEVPGTLEELRERRGGR